jgi:hypothetical protein
VGSRAGLDDMETRKFLIPSGLEFRPLGRPARSKLLYRLSYTDSYRSFYINSRETVYIINIGQYMSSLGILLQFKGHA